MIPGTVSMFVFRIENSTRENQSFRPPSVNKAYICGNRMGDMGLD